MQALFHSQSNFVPNVSAMETCPEDTQTVTTPWQGFLSTGTEALHARPPRGPPAHVSLFAGPHPPHTPSYPLEMTREEEAIELLDCNLKSESLRETLIKHLNKSLLILMTSICLKISFDFKIHRYCT